VLQAPTTQGSVWLKATGPANAFEVGLYGFLNRVAPARVPPVIATDIGRGWVLLADGGPTLGEK